MSKFQYLSALLHLKTNSPFKKLLPIMTMLALQLWVATSAYRYLDGGAVNGMTLSTTPEAWAKRMAGCDAAGYLSIANSLVSGHGFTLYCDSCNPPHYERTNYWGPGAPVGYAIGLWIGKLMGFHSMKVIFWFAFVCDFVSGLMLLLTFWLYSNNLLASLVCAVFCGYAPPLQGFVYSWTLTASETIHAVPITMTFYFLARGLKKFWKGNSLPITQFALSGFCLGLAGITRESNYQFAVFTTVLFVIQAIIRRPKSLRTIFLLALIFFSSALLPRKVTQTWNQHRLGQAVVSHASPDDHPSEYYFSKFDPTPGFGNSVGLNLGDYLNPEATKRIEQARASGHLSNRMVYFELAKSILKSPLKALRFKLIRAPTFYLGTDIWPHTELSWPSVWALFMYVTFFSYLFYTVFLLKKWPLEITYYYLTFITLAYILIHSEFRYTFPALIPLRVVPGIVLALFLNHRYKVDALES
jgi:hypothetical protein